MNYITQSEREFELRKKIVNIINESDDSFFYSERPNQFLDELVKIFPILKWIKLIIFETSPFSAKTFRELNSTITDTEDIVKYNFKLLPKVTLDKMGYFSSFDDKNLFMGLNEKYHDEGSINVRYISPNNNRIRMVIIEKYNLKIKEAFNNLTIDELYNHFLLLFIANESKREAKVLEDSIRVTGHEASQIIPSLKHIVNSTFSNFENLKLIIQSNTLHKKVTDINNSLDLLVNILTKPSFIFRNVQGHMSDFDLNREIIFKLRNIYSKMAIHKQVSIDISNNNKPCLINSDIKLLEHAIMNVFDNAMKYSYRGTRISVEISCKAKNIEISILNYGPSVDIRNNIYKLYYRGNDVTTEGLGIGLFVTNKLLNALGGTISHSSTLISEFNTSCLGFYFMNKNQFKIDESLERDLIHAYENESDLILNSMARSKNGELLFNPGRITFESLIQEATYLTKFNIKLPLNNQMQ